MNNATSFVFPCPHCGTWLEAETSQIGEEADCPACHKPFQVKAPEKVTVSLNGKKYFLTPDGRVDLSGLGFFGSMSAAAAAAKANLGIYDKATMRGSIPGYTPGEGYYPFEFRDKRKKVLKISRYGSWKKHPLVLKNPEAAALAESEDACTTDLFWAVLQSYDKAVLNGDVRGVEKASAALKDMLSSVRKENGSSDATALSVGAEGDGPNAGESIPKDNRFDFPQKGFVYSDESCPSCGSPFKALYRRVVDFSESPRLKAAVSDGSYFLFACPHCGNQVRLSPMVHVVDPANGYYIKTFPDRHSALAYHKCRNAVFFAENTPGDFSVPARNRIVVGTRGLIEKMAVFESGLDDYAVESAKQEIVQENGLDGKTTDIHFEGMESGNLRFSVSFKDGRTGTASVPRDLYDSLKASFDAIGRFSENVFRFVDRSLMVGPDADSDDWWDGKEPKPGHQGSDSLADPE